MPHIMDSISIEAELILTTLERHGFTALVVGGFVRDFLLGLPAKDLDIATNARPGQIQDLFPEGKILSPSQAFPVVLVQGIEVATFRRDLDANSRQDVRVEYANGFTEDAMRRDFTVNSLGYALWGEVQDPTGLGIQDLENRLIRFVGNPEDRLREDGLRALRAIRLAAKLGFTLEKQTRIALTRFGNNMVTTR